MWQIDSIIHKLKPRSFHKFASSSTEFTHSTHLQVYTLHTSPSLHTPHISKSTLWTFTLWCEPYLTVLSDFQVCCCFWAVLSAKSFVIVLFAKQLSHFKIQWPSPTIILQPIQCCSNHSSLKDKWSHNQQSSPVGYQVTNGGITRELDKEPSLYYSSIYISYMWSVLQQY